MSIIPRDCNDEVLAVEDIVYYEARLHEIWDVNDFGLVFLEEINEGYMQPLGWVEGQSCRKLMESEYERHFGKNWKNPPYATGGPVVMKGAIINNGPDSPERMTMLAKKLIKSSRTYEIIIPSGGFHIPLNYSNKNHQCDAFTYFLDNLEDKP